MSRGAPAPLRSTNSSESPLFSSYGRSLISGDICGQPGAAQQASRPAFEHLQLEVARQHHFVAAVAVEIVNLERRVVGQQVVPRVRPALLPQDSAIERDRGQAADLIEGVAAHLRDLLREQHVELAVAVEIAEADVAAGAEAFRVELAPQLRPRILRPQPSRARARGARCAGAGRSAAAALAVTRKSLKRAGMFAVMPAMPARQFAVADVDQLLAVDGSTQPIAFGTAPPADTSVFVSYGNGTAAISRHALTRNSSSIGSLTASRSRLPSSSASR